MLGSGTVWISILACRPKVKLRSRDPCSGQSVTLSPLTHSLGIRLRGAWPTWCGGWGGVHRLLWIRGEPYKPRLGEDAPANQDREGRGFGRGLKKLVAGPRTETELQRRWSSCWAPAVRTKIGSCVATLDSRVSVHRVTGRDPCVHPH